MVFKASYIGVFLLAFSARRVRLKLVLLDVAKF